MEADALLGGLSREIRVFDCVRKKDRVGKGGRREKAESIV